MEPIRKRPWLAALIVFVLVVIPGFLRIEHVAEQTKQTAEDDINRNRAVIQCLTNYATGLTDALNDRDAINTVARGAAEEYLKTFRRLLVNPPIGKPNQAREEFLEALSAHLRSLDRITRTTSLSPYPDPKVCFGHIGVEPEGIIFASALVAPGTWDDFCWGKRVTIRGTWGDDVIHGTDGPDVIFAYAGDDIIVSGKGSDRICGRKGGDTINAGRGFDYVNCGKGVDNAQQAERRLRCEG